MIDVCGLGLIANDIIFLKHGEEYTYIGSDIGMSTNNTLCTLSVLGISTKVLGAAGNDGCSKFAIKRLKYYGVNTDSLVIRESHSIRTVYCIIDCDNQNLHYYKLKCPVCDRETLNAAKFFVNDINEDFIKSIENSKIFYLDRVNEGTLEAAKIAANLGKTVMLDFGYFDEEKLSLYKEFFKYVTVLKTNDDIVEKLYNSHQIESFSDAYENIKLIFITKGANGVDCIFRADGKVNSASFKACNVDKFADAVGAGDAFAAGITYKIIEYGEQILDCMNELVAQNMCSFAQSLAAKACSFHGALGFIKKCR